MRTKVLVSGATGFLGGHLVHRLREEGAEVTAPSSRECDLLDADNASRLLSSSPRYVFHLAARVGGIGANRERPADLYLDNLLMGTFVLDSALQAGTAKPVMRRGHLAHWARAQHHTAAAVDLQIDKSGTQDVAGGLWQTQL